MGRKRAHDDPLRPLPLGLYQHHRKYRARDALGQWVNFAGPYEDACRAYRAFRQRGTTQGYDGSVAWLLDWFLTEIAPAMLRPRTLRDYLVDAETVRTGIGTIPYAALTAANVARYRDVRAETAPIHVNRELAVLRASYAAAMEHEMVNANPATIKRMKEHKRLRLVTDAEYLTVYHRAPRPVQIAMTLALRTLARPADVLAFGPRHVHRLDDQRRILRWQQGKTGRYVEVYVEGELAQIVDEHAKASIVRPTFARTRTGSGYTIDGFGAVFRRLCRPTDDENKPVGEQVLDFGLRDLRAKGASDMWEAGADIRHISALLGHASIRTTEIYLKSLKPERVRPNDRAVIAGLK
jgi:integrase